MITAETAMMLSMALDKVIGEARASYNDANIGQFVFRIQAEGRVTDNLKLTYGFGTYTYPDCYSHSVRPALEEFLRRHGWNGQNNGGKLLPYVPDDPQF